MAYLFFGNLSGCPIERISHIGSTAISGIWAKDIVDVLIEVSADSDIQNTAGLIGTVWISPHVRRKG